MPIRVPLSGSGSKNDPLIIRTSRKREAHGEAFLLKDKYVIFVFDQALENEDKEIDQGRTMRNMEGMVKSHKIDKKWQAMMNKKMDKMRRVTSEPIPDYIMRALQPKVKLKL